jgi:hypothetical protein
MIESIRTYSDHTLIGIFVEGLPALAKSIRDAIINHIALSILVQVAISLPLFYFHHNLFSLGFVLGFAGDKLVQEMVHKVNVVYNAPRTLLESCLLFAGGGFLASLTMPTSMIFATLYYSAQWGAMLYQSCLARYLQANPPLSMEEGTKKPGTPESSVISQEEGTLQETVISDLSTGSTVTADKGVDFTNTEGGNPATVSPPLFNSANLEVVVQ